MSIVKQKRMTAMKLHEREAWGDVPCNAISNNIFSIEVYI